MTEQNTEHNKAIDGESGCPAWPSSPEPYPLSQDDYDRIQKLAQGDAEWVDVPTIAALMGVSPWTIYRAIKRKEIPNVRIGNCIRINRRAFDAAMKRRMEGTLENEC